MFFYVLIIILFLLFLFSVSISITCALISLFSYPLRDGFVFLVPHVDEKDLLPVSGATIKVKKLSCNCVAIEKLGQKKGRIGFCEVELFVVQRISIDDASLN